MEANGISLLRAMNILGSVNRLIEVAERARPSLAKSKLYRRARDQALRDAFNAHLAIPDDDDDDMGAREGSLEDEICLEENRESGNDMSELLTSILKRPPRGISKSSTERTNVVKLSR